MYLQLSPSSGAPAFASTLATYSSIEVSAAGLTLLGAEPAPLDSESLLALITEAVEAAVGGPVGADQPLMAAGLDSLGATELQQGLADTLGLELPSTLVFDYPTISALAAYIGGKLGGAQSGAVSLHESLGTASQHEAGSASGAVAIVGAAGQNVLLQRPGVVGDAISRVPHSRWDVDWAGITADGTMAAQVRGGRLLLLPVLELPGASATPAHHLPTRHPPASVWRFPERRGAV